MITLDFNGAFLVFVVSRHPAISCGLVLSLLFYRLNPVNHTGWLCCLRLIYGLRQV